MNHWIRFLAVGAAYGVAFIVFRQAFPFSLTSPWFVGVAMICFLGLASVVPPAARLRMPHALRRIRAWETESAIYRSLRVPAFGGLLRHTPLRLLNRGVYLGTGARDAARLSTQLEAAEASHFWDAMLVGPYVVYAAVQGAWDTAAWFSLAQVLVNAYPMMHLRLSRGRLDRLATRGDRLLARRPNSTRAGQRGATQMQR
jgi:hypothetical protein